jgi:G3E family GTPase
MTEFNLITGFLGSGKTSLIKNILDEYSQKKRIAVIQNEFAPTGIDGKELKRSANDFHLIEINNGSVFCVCMLGSFIQAMEKLIKDYQPEMIFLEASGLADPINIIELLQSPQIKDHITLKYILSVVDAPNFMKGAKALPRYRHQIMVSDYVLINKTDLFEGNISEISKEIKELNPYAELSETQYCQIPAGIFYSESSNANIAAKKFIGRESEGRPSMNVGVVRTHQKISRENLVLLIQKIQKDCPRIKAYVNLLEGKIAAVQSVYDDLQIEIIDSYLGPTELIFFSEKLSLKDFRELFKKYAEK